MIEFDRRSVLGVLGATACASLPVRAFAQAGDPRHFTGPDREAKLVAGAKKEGTLTLYSSAVLEDMNAVATGFQKKYGVKVNLWRGGSEEILQRTVTEARGNRFDVDVVETAAPQIEPIVREKILSDVETPAAADIMPGAKIPGRPWIPARLVVMTGAYNTRLIKPADLPKSYDDLTNPKWKGKLGIESDDNNWLMAISGVMGEEKATKLLREIVVKNGISVRKGHTLMANMVVSGEVPIALTIYHHEVEPMSRAGAPIAELNIAPEIAFATGAGVAKRAPHPYAAVLFLDYLLTDGQQILAARGTIPTNVKYQKLPAEWKLAFMDVPKYMDEAAKWTKLYKDALTQPR
ncbi:MAG TPA: extracellular solute-binding protein [Micropepsaceae bacterium]|nr:extracellular solute-binding protein [Micropepsaceae bacterium]